MIIQQYTTAQPGRERGEHMGFSTQACHQILQWETNTYPSLHTSTNSKLFTLIDMFMNGWVCTGMTFDHYVKSFLSLPPSHWASVLGVCFSAKLILQHKHGSADHRAVLEKITMWALCWDRRTEIQTWLWRQGRICQLQGTAATTALSFTFSSQLLQHFPFSLSLVWLAVTRSYDQGWLSV